MMRRFLLGVGALLAIALILVGVPAALIIVAGNPIPTSNQVHNIITLVPDYGNVILLTKVLPCLGWIAWILFAIPMLIEIGAGIAGRKTTKRVWLLKGQQYAAAALVTAVLVMFAGIGAMHMTSPPVAAAPPPPTVSIEPASPDPAATPESEPRIEPAATAAAASGTPALQTLTHLVVPGDNLWDISETYYGAGTRDTDIFQASTNILQPGGQRLTNPNLIRPGWRLDIPDVPVPPAPTADSDPAPAPVPETGEGNHLPEFGAQPAPEPDSTPSPIPAPSRPTATTPSPAPSHSAKADTSAVPHSDPAIPLGTAGGIVGVLAAALLLVLGGRRLNQRRRRRTGERIAMPDPAAAEFEQELRMVADPVGLTDIEHALRLLQAHSANTGTALPELLAVRLTAQEMAFYLVRAANLPAPFEPLTPDRTAWTLRPGTIPTTLQGTVCPYPALVIIGVDDNDGILLVDLEQLGVLNVVGDQELARGVLNALAGELAGNPWGEQIQVSLVGMDVAFPHAIDRFRIQHANHLDALLPELRNDLGERSAALHSYGIDDVHAARILATETEAWAPHILVLDEVPDDTVRRELAEMVAADRRLGFALAVRGEIDATRATLRIESSDRALLLLPGGSVPPLPFTPQLLRGRELELLQDLLDTTNDDATHPEPHAREQNVTTVPPGAEIPLPEPREPSPDPHPLPTAGTPATPQTLPERVPETRESDPVLVPYLRLLGPVEADGLNPDEPMPARGIELMAYLLLRRGPVDGLQLQRAFWPNTPDAANNQRGLAKKVRVALGHGPSGELWLPENTNHHGYVLHPAIRSDWDDFRALVGDDPTLATSDDLIAALRLARGTPFAASNTRRWWQWIAIPQEEMIAALMDAADELGNRALDTRNTSLARYAARVEQAVDPLNEAGWRIELRAALQVADLDGFHAILEDLYARVGGDDPDYDVDDETRILIDQANQRIRA
ncbi:MAG TPA: hypothetical protein VHZ98_02365 [Galbitalea sp.]|jgi:hypothetical protein|nr:hypothetical protein [Galbitalea sp.]